MLAYHMHDTSVYFIFLGVYPHSWKNETVAVTVKFASNHSLKENQTNVSV